METKNLSVRELAELLVSESGTGREQIEYIPLASIDGDERNFYSMTDIDSLAENIEFLGLQQPLRVREHPMDPDRVILVSGHRRKAALEKLVEEGRNDLAEVPCIVEHDAGSEALQELRLIYANSDTRQMTSAEISNQAKRVEALLYQLKEEGFEFPGRMRDHVAEACKISKSKLARLKVIRDGLSPDWAKLWEKGKIPEETAYQVARLSEDAQAYALITARKKSRVEYFYASTAKLVGEALTLMDENRPNCPQEDVPCPHLDHMKKMTAEEDHWYSNPCAGRCCINCSHLDACKFFCDHAEPELKRRKDERKKAVSLKKREAAQREVPLVEMNTTLWSRVAKARQAADISVEDLFTAMGRYRGPSSDEEFKGFESGKKHVTGFSETPYGICISAGDAITLVRAADKLGVSIDYLLGRTDVPEVAGSGKESK